MRNWIDSTQNGNYESKMKSFSLAYNEHETRDKRPLGRFLDRSWCQLYTSIKLFWSQPMAPWTSVASYKCAASKFMDPWAAIKKALH